MTRRTERRTFILHAVAGAAAVASPPLLAADPVSTVKLTETEPYPRSMGFRLDTKDVDQAKYPRHTVEQHCAKCQLFSGKQGEAWGPCSFYGGRLVPVDGWCRNFKVRKA